MLTNFMVKWYLQVDWFCQDSIIAFYTDYEKGRYVKYDPKDGKENACVVDSIDSTSNYSPNNPFGISTVPSKRHGRELQINSKPPKYLIWEILLDLHMILNGPMIQR